MYTWEIEQLLKERNNIIYNDEYIKMIKESPQIKHVKYNPNNNFYETWTKEDNKETKYFKYKVKRREKRKLI